MFQSHWKRVDKRALLDSGTTENFMHLRAVKQLKLKTTSLSHPRKVRNVDGTTNTGGDIHEFATLEVLYNGRKHDHRFFVADIGPDNFILGYPFFEASSPNINWRQGSLDGAVTISTNDAATLIERIHKPRKKSKTPAWVRVIPGWEPGDEVWCQTTIRKMTVAQQLAIDVADKTKRSWQELVPERYHKFASVFSEEGSKKFPDQRPWDHAIDLKPDAPTSINCRVYPLSPAEKEEQQKFLQQNLRLKCIRCSKSPYASGFFFIKKKDGKFRPVQDY